MDFAIQDKVAVVTGGATGIGAAVSSRFASEGAKVAINVLELDEVAIRLCNHLRSSGGQVEVFQADVSCSDQVSSMVDKIHGRFGMIDILINNAGIYPRCDWAAMTGTDWDRVVDVNMKGQFLCAHACYADMVEGGWGRIVNVSSNLVLLGKSQLVHYISAKAGVIGLTRALARELGEFGICVNCVIPGAIRVAREIELYPDQENVTRRLLERQCIKRRGSPADLLGLFCLLASPASDFITGQSINVDGGWALY